MKKVRITGKVAMHSFITLSESISCTLFLHSTGFPGIIQKHKERAGYHSYYTVVGASFCLCWQGCMPAQYQGSKISWCYYCTYLFDAIIPFAFYHEDKYIAPDPTTY